MRAPSGSGEGQPSRGLFIIKSGDLSTKPSIGFMILEAVLLKLFIIFFFNHLIRKCVYDRIVYLNIVKKGINIFSKKGFCKGALGDTV